MRKLVAPVVFVALLLGAWRLLPNSLFYARRVPTRLGRATNGFMALWSGAGFPPSWQVALETTGRRSGRTYVIPVVVAEVDQQQYLVSMLGERSQWVRNLRAAGGHAVIRHGRRRPIIAQDVPVEERAPVIKAYLARATGARPHVDLPPDAPAEQFAAIASRYPVFHIINVADAAIGNASRTMAGKGDGVTVT